MTAINHDRARTCKRISFGKREKVSENEKMPACAPSALVLARFIEGSVDAVAPPARFRKIQNFPKDGATLTGHNRGRDDEWLRPGRSPKTRVVQRCPSRQKRLW
jgi:hypothetical protein